MSKEELLQINGGGFSLGLGLVLGGLVTFFIGLIDGYTRPLACR